MTITQPIDIRDQNKQYVWMHRCLSCALEGNKFSWGVYNVMYYFGNVFLESPVNTRIKRVIWYIIKGMIWPYPPLLPYGYSVRKNYIQTHRYKVRRCWIIIMSLSIQSCLFLLNFRRSSNFIVQFSTKGLCQLTH